MTLSTVASVCQLVPRRTIGLITRLRACATHNCRMLAVSKRYHSRKVVRPPIAQRDLAICRWSRGYSNRDVGSLDWDRYAVVDGEWGGAEQTEDNGDDCEHHDNDACSACRSNCYVTQRVTDAEVPVDGDRQNNERRERNVRRYQELQAQHPH